MWILKSDELFHSFFHTELPSWICGTVTISTNEDFVNMLIIHQVGRLCFGEGSELIQKSFAQASVHLSAVTLADVCDFGAFQSEHKRSFGAISISR